MEFKSKHPNTISFTEDRFGELMDKEWSELTCIMSGGNRINVTRSELIRLWASERKYKTTPHKLKIKVLKVC